MHTPSKFWQTAMAFLAALTILALVFIVKEIKAIGYVGANPNQTNTITVDGTGDAFAAPDVATFTFTVTETAKTVADAQTAATTKLNAALKAVRDGGVADKDISTQAYNINPHYEYQNAVCPASATVSGTTYCPPGRQVLTGYDVSETVQVKVRDLSQAGTLFAAIGSLNVESVNGLTFSVDDPTAVQAEARAKAIDDAKTKAEELAKQLGVELGPIMSFSENNGSYPRPMVYGMGAASFSTAKADLAPQVPTGEQKVTDNVSITYEIE